MDAPSPASRSAIFVAAGRAIGTRDPDPTVRNPDYLAEKLVGDPSSLNQSIPTVRALSETYQHSMKDLAVANCVRMMIVRTRFVDAALSRAVSRGATQLVLLGAGLDSYGYRYPELLNQVRVFELDRPEMQAFKRQRVNAALEMEPKNVRYVGIDFRHGDLNEVLVRHGYDPAQRTFFVMEGVSMYVPEQVVSNVLRLVARHESGSGIALDFLFGRPQRTPASCVIPRGREHNFFGDRGLRLEEVLAVNSGEAANRYLTRLDGTQVGAEAINEATSRMIEQPASIPVQSPWGGVVWQIAGPLRYHISEAVVA